MTPCAFQAAGADPNDPFALVVTTQNNQCARQIRQTLIELQRVTKEQLTNGIVQSSIGADEE